MSTIGWIGLGKLGLPSAIAIADKGHFVVGVDPSPTPWVALNNGKMPTLEPGAQAILNKWGNAQHDKIVKVELNDLAKVAELIFIAVPTDHHPDFGGTKPLPPDRADFSYNHLIRAIDDLVFEARGKQLNVAIVSTVLPGTIRRLILSRVPSSCHIVYNPFFIAMGKVVEDFYNPEFVLIGKGSQRTADLLAAFYKTIHSKTVHITGLEESEMIKVCYNTFITLKITYANVLGELCHKTGIDVDTVTRILGEATDRLISTKYLRAGGGDSGACHPRDNIAMSWLARKNKLSYDLFEQLMIAREAHARWIAELLAATKQPIVLFGTAFKSESNIQTGSWVLLVANILEQVGIKPILYDPLIDPPREWKQPATFLIGTWHRTMIEFQYPKGSVVFDPWGYVPTGDDRVKVIKIGRSS